MKYFILFAFLLISSQAFSECYQNDDKSEIELVVEHSRRNVYKVGDKLWTEVPGVLTSYNAMAEACAKLNLEDLALGAKWKTPTVKDYLAAEQMGIRSHLPSKPGWFWIEKYCPLDPTSYCHLDPVAVDSRDGKYHREPFDYLRFMAKVVCISDIP